MWWKICAVVALSLAAIGAAAEPCGEIDDMDAQLACFDRYAECAGIVGDAERLACYQGARTAAAESGQATPVADPAPQSRPGPAVVPAAETVAEPAPVASPAVVSKPAASSEAQTDDEVFPLQGRPAPTQKRAQISAAITRVRTNPQGIVYLDLDNGQVWKETTRSKFRYKPGLQVTITEGSFGSTNLHAEGMRKYTKVVRVN